MEIFMEKKISAFNSEMTQTYKKEDDLYHRYAVFFGLSDPAVWVLYSLYEDEDKEYTQNDLVSMWFCPKQTVNYTVGKLSEKGLLTLSQRQVARNSKSVRLTEAGRRLCEEKILPLMRAEEGSLMRLTDEEREQLLRLKRKYIDYFEEEINKITEIKESKR